MPTATAPQSAALIDTGGLDELYRALVAEGYHVIGPAVQDGAITLRELSGTAELPFGWGVRLAPGGHRLRRRDDEAAFGHSAGPQSWKRFLHPPRERLWSARRDGGGFELADDAGDEQPRYAFLGVRPCDLRAIAIQDRVLDQPGSRYAARRARLFIVAVNCTEPGETCFCTSMGAGPASGPGFDLSLTELLDEDGAHRFLADVGSDAGAAIMERVTSEPADEATAARARSDVHGAAVTAAAARQASPAPPPRQASPAAVPAPPMRPVRYLVVGRKAETYDTVTLLLRPVAEPIEPPRPGQFTMLYAFGVGEVPVSVSGASGSGASGSGSSGGLLVQTIRAVGAVTRALCAAAPGDMIGVRGPFGTGWEAHRADGRDMLVVAGGIGLAPLRPVLLSALAERARYDRVVLLVGVRSPQDLPFARELGTWRRRGADVRVTVDHGDQGWDGHVGLVTGLIKGAIADPAGTAAFVCGPEIMMRLSAEMLVHCGVPVAAIRVSLERNMRCGAALCGHCQLGPLLLCRDGPVVGYADAAPLAAKKEL